MVDMMTDKCWLQKQYISETAIEVYKILYRIFDDAPGVHNFKNLPPGMIFDDMEGMKIYTLHSFFNLRNTCLPKKIFVFLLSPKNHLFPQFSK